MRRRRSPDPHRGRVLRRRQHRACAAPASSSWPGVCGGATSSRGRDIAAMAVEAGAVHRSSARTSRTWPGSGTRPWPSSPATRSPRSTASARRSTTRSMADKIWPGTRALAQSHLERGQEVWLVTATPVEVATRHRPPARASRALSAPWPRASTASTPGAWSASRCTAPVQGRGRRGARRRRGPGPVLVLGLLRLRQRHPDALARRPPLRGQPRRGAARARPRPRLAGPRLPPGPPGRKLGLRAAAATALAGALAASARRRRG